MASSNISKPPSSDQYENKRDLDIPHILETTEKEVVGKPSYVNALFLELKEHAHQYYRIRRHREVRSQYFYVRTIEETNKTTILEVDLFTWLYFTSESKLNQLNEALPGTRKQTITITATKKVEENQNETLLTNEKEWHSQPKAALILRYYKRQRLDRIVRGGAVPVNTPEDYCVDAKLRMFFKPEDDPDNCANHYGVRRLNGFYSHHFLSYGVRENSKAIYLTICHYSTGLGLDGLKLSLCRAKMQVITASKKVGENDEELLYLDAHDWASENGANIFRPLLDGKVDRIRNDLYYPQSYQDKQMVLDRMESKLGIQQYNPTVQNCQHLITYALTDFPYSEDAMKRILFCPLVELCTVSPIELLLEKIAGSLATLSIHMPKHIGKVGGKEAFLRSIAGGSSDGWKGIMNNGFSAVSNALHVAKVAAVGFGISLAIEAVILFFQTLSDYRCYKQKKIDWKTFLRNLGRNALSSGGSLIGSLLGVILGMCIPLPGAMIICAAAGGFLGRLCVKAVHGTIGYYNMKKQQGQKAIEPSHIEKVIDETPEPF